MTTKLAKLTRSVVDFVRVNAGLLATHMDPSYAALGQHLLSFCDLAVSYLDAPERDTTEDERATWGTCPECGKEHGWDCVYTALRGGRAEPHPARLDAAPMRVRLVPAP